MRAAARAGAAAGHLCVADEQTAGRGRQGRSWVAPAGSALLASILLRPRANAEGVPLAAGLAVADAVARLGVEVGLKWPNDVVVDGAKLAGILAEVEPAAPGPDTAVVLGIGVNLCVDEFPQGVNGASLHRLLDPAPPPSAEELLTLLLPALAARVGTLEAGASRRSSTPGGSGRSGSAVRSSPRPRAAGSRAGRSASTSTAPCSWRREVGRSGSSPATPTSSRRSDRGGRWPPPAQLTVIVPAIPGAWKVQT